MTDKRLFEAYSLGPIPLANRIVMAPLTRNRAGPGLVPSEHAATYYSQRATAGLLIAEATQISAQAQGYQDTPGLYTAAQIAGWRKVTDAVHARGGRIFVQLWHVGRVSHVTLQPDGAAPVAPSALRAQTKTFVNNEFVEVSMPRALALEELPGIVDDFRQAAANAMAAGFDGVEIHGANGYLLSSSSRMGPTCVPTAMAAPSRTARGCCSRSLPPWPRRSGPIAPGSGSPPSHRPMASPAAIPSRSTTISSSGSVRWASSTCT